jgi:5'(3')-deoxyribonucleotidase
MRFYEWGRIVKGVNTTPDVSTNEIPRQAKKFGNTVDKDGRPPTLSKKVKGKSTNVLFNLGLAEDKKVEEKWSAKYKRSINCSNPKGFSQKAHCAGRNKNEAQELSMTSEIYVDMDGVLADFFGDWAKLMGKDHWTKIDDISPALQKIRDTEDFWLNLPLTDNAKNLLTLIKDVKGEYNILSSPLPDDPNSEPHKREWIKKNLNFFLPKQVIITHDKAKYATSEDGTPNILIDDYGQNIAKWEAAGGIGFKHKDHKFERTAKAIKQHMHEPVEERELTKDEEKDKEKYVKGMKKNKSDFKKRYGDDAEAVMYATATKMAKEALRSGRYTPDQILEILENFADGKVKGKSRPGRVKRAGASCSGSVTELRQKAKNASGERAKMYHWCANMKAGRNK